MMDRVRRHNNWQDFGLQQCALWRTIGQAADNCPKRHHVDVRKYLKDVLDRLPAGETDYAKAVPHAWKLEHPKAVRVYHEEESSYKS